MERPLGAKPGHFTPTSKSLLLCQCQEYTGVDHEASQERLILFVFAVPNLLYSMSVHAADLDIESSQLLY